MPAQTIYMKKVGYTALLATILIACGQSDSVKKETAMPPKPASVDAALAAIKNKDYVVEEVGTIDLFQEWDWSAASADTSKFYRDFMDERKAFALNFINDTAVNVNDDKRTFEAKYDIQKDTGTALLLNLKYMDSTFSFTPGELSLITSTYKIHGVDDNKVLLETPRELNRRKVIVLMIKK